MNQPDPDRPQATQWTYGNVPTGSISTWIRKLRRCLASQGQSMEVPCGTCVACCQHLHIDLEPDELTQGLATQEVDGVKVLAKREDGSCVYLVQNQCQIYGQRPRTCRIFDCRGYLICGAFPGTHEGLRRALERWRPEINSRQDQEIFIALRLATQWALGQGASAVAAVATAVKGYEAWLGEARTIAKRMRDQGIK